MRDREVELDAERGPGAAISDQGLLDRRVRIEHLLAADLVDAAVQVPAQVGQHRDAQVLVLQVQGAPRFGAAVVRQRVADRVGIVEPAASRRGRTGDWGWEAPPGRSAATGSTPTHAPARVRRRDVQPRSPQRGRERRQVWKIILELGEMAGVGFPKMWSRHFSAGGRSDGGGPMAKRAGTEKSRHATALPITRDRPTTAKPPHLVRGLECGA